MGDREVGLVTNTVPGLLLGGALLLLGVIGWLMLRGPKVLSGLREVRKRQNAMNQHRESLVEQTAKAMGNRTAETEVGSVEVKKSPPEVPPPGQYILVAGAVVGIVAGVAMTFASPIKGVVPGALLGVGGAVAGAFIARPIAIAVNSRAGK